MKKILKRLAIGFLAFATIVTALPTTAVHASETQYWTESAERAGYIEKVMNNGSIASTFNEGIMKVEDETAYCVDINTNFKNGYKTRADASTRMSADQISDVALSLEYVKQYAQSHSELNYKQVYLLEQCVVWQRLSVHLGWQCDNVRASYDEISKAVQDEVYAGAKAFASENKGRYECGGYIYSGEGQDIGQFWAKLAAGNATLKKTSSNASITEGNGLYSIAGATFLNADMDVVVIGTPIPFHEEQAVKALQAGKHVLSEVTMANTIDGCWAIYEAAKRAKGKYMLAENYMYFHFIQEWKKYVDADWIGRIHYAEAEYIHDIRNLLVDKNSGETFWRTYRPPIHYCTHCLGPLLYLMGDDYIVKATASGNKNTILPELWPSTIDMQVALFETKKGRIFKSLRSQVTPRTPHIVTYNIYGTHGSLETGRTPGYDTVGMRYFEGSDHAAVPMNCNGTKLDAPLYTKFGGHGTSDYFGAQAFLDCIEFDQEPYLNVDRAMELTIPGLVAQEAAVKEHVWLDVPHF